MKTDSHYEKQRGTVGAIFGWLAIIGSGGGAIWCWGQAEQLKRFRELDYLDQDDDLDEVEVVIPAINELETIDEGEVEAIEVAIDEVEVIDEDLSSQQYDIVRPQLPASNPHPVSSNVGLALIGLVCLVMVAGLISAVNSNPRDFLSTRDSISQETSASLPNGSTPDAVAADSLPDTNDPFFRQTQEHVLSLIDAELSIAFKRSVTDKGSPFSTLKYALPVRTSTAITSGSIVRVVAKSNVLEIQDDGVLVTLDGVLCKVLFLNEQAVGLRARLANTTMKGGSIDEVFLVGPSEKLKETGFYGRYLYPVFFIQSLVNENDLAHLIEMQFARKDVSKFRKVFTDLSGKFSVDAIPVKLDGEHVHLFRFDSRIIVVVQIDRLSYADKLWIARNRDAINEYGPRVSDFLQAETLDVDDDFPLD